MLREISGFCNKPDNVYSLADLSWNLGSWTGYEIKDENSVADEDWRDAVGDAMMGMFRWATGGTVHVYAFMNMQQIDDTVVLLLKGFDAALVGVEEKDAVITLSLISTAHSDNTHMAVFCGESPTQRQRLTWRLETIAGEPARRTAVYEIENEGETIRMDFEFQLK